MVRANSNEDFDDKKNNTSKKNAKAASKSQKNPSSGIWPCRINGCNKQFAREADLKRHQRTTKLHSMPGFSCPQCDATFTRTDALRRHQKSRHNGVVDAPEPGRESDEPTQSSSRSSSAAPSSKGKERENSTVPMTEPVVGKSLSSLATPVTSYYRQHTANNSSYPPRPATYAQVSLPTSSARTDGYPWPEGQAPPPLGGLHLMYITPYYRTNTVTAPPPLLTPVSQSFTDLSSHRKSSIDSKSPDSPKSVSSTSTNAVDNDTSMVDPPSLPIHRSPSPENREFRQFLSEAGMEAVTANDDEYASRQSVDVDRRPDAWRREESPLDSSRHTERFPNPEGNRDRIRNYTSRPMSLLTGDGGAILNPVDLLTQESLAPPEPS